MKANNKSFVNPIDNNLDFITLPEGSLYQYVMDRYNQEIIGAEAETNEALLSKILGNMKASPQKSLSKATDSQSSSSYYKKQNLGDGLDDKYFTPKKKRELSSRYGDMSTQMNTPAQPFESVDNSEVIDIRAIESKVDIKQEEETKLKSSCKSEGRVTPVKAIFDEWSLMTEYEVKQNLYLKKLFRVVSSVRVNSLNFGEEVL